MKTWKIPVSWEVVGVSVHSSKVSWCLRSSIHMILTVCRKSISATRYNNFIQGLPRA